MSKKINVMVVDDSAVVRQALTGIIQAAPNLELMGTASDPIFALQKMEAAWPDVIILDIEMPRMDGITFLRKIMSERPTPVVICSSLAEKGAETTFEALTLGAVDIITKPKLGLKNFLEDSAQKFMESITAASLANLKIHPPKSSAGSVVRKPIERSTAMAKTTQKFIALGASTGGTQAIETILKSLPRTAPGIVIVQHMPEGFTKKFADRLNRISEMEVKEAETGDKIISGRVIVAQGNHHLVVGRSGAVYSVSLKDGPLVNRHRPNVDVLFRSVAKFAGKNAMGVLLSGMGTDGAAGMEEMKAAGSFNVAQNEKTCIVYGMPKAAVERGVVDDIVPLDDIAERILNVDKYLK